MPMLPLGAYDARDLPVKRHLPGKHNQKDHGHGHAAGGSSTKSGAHPATRKELDDAVDRLQREDPEKYWMVAKTHDGAKPFALYADDGSRKGFFALYEHDGGSTVEIGTVVALPGSRGVVADTMKATDEMYPDAKQKLDCFDGHLPKIYGKHGFVETDRIQWDDQYAPDAWKPEYGRPDVVFMERPPAKDRRSLRHLPGKHNQKDHGHDHVHGDYTPGAWKTGSREDAVDVASEQLFQGLWSRRGDADAHAEFGKDMLNDEAKLREYSRTVAERSFGKTAWALTNGPHRITGTNGKPDLKLAEHVDDLQTRFPVKGSIHILSDNQLPSWVNGETDLATGHIRLQRSLGNRKGFPGEEPDWSVPVAKTTSNRQYVLAHEWGHRLEHDGMQSKEGGANHIVYKLFDTRIAARKAGGLSGYGDSDDHEAFAESFAEWSLSRGKTTNPAARVYAEAFGWGE